MYRGESILKSHQSAQKGLLSNGLDGTLKRQGGAIPERADAETANRPPARDLR